MTTGRNGGHGGRPRQAATEAAILGAAVELIGERGVTGTTLAAVARRAGVARATIYLRWPTRAALVGAAARSAVGGGSMALTGDVERDIQLAAEFIDQVFALPTFPSLLPEIVRGVLSQPQELPFEAVAPRRGEFGRLYRENAAAQGFATDVDPFLAFDVILGTAIGHLLADGRPMAAGQTARLAEVLIDGLKHRRD